MSFELGRPLGVPNNPEFQMRVLRATLDLFAEKSGPVLAEYPEHSPNAAGSEDSWVCPVTFKAPSDAAKDDDIASALALEISELSPWYEYSRERRGRSIFGVSGLNVQDCARFLGSLLTEDAPEGRIPDVSLGESLKRASEDLFAWYTEAAAAQPGETTPSIRALENWFWSETMAGRVFLDLARTRHDHPDPLVRRVVERNLVPWTQKHRLQSAK